MSYEKTVNVQDTFLNHMRKNRFPITIFLVNGVKLQGSITWFDNAAILLKREGNSQLVYKSAISTIMSHAPVNLFESNNKDNNKNNDNNNNDHDQE